MNVREIQSRLKRAGRTQTELAGYLGLTHGQISRLLTGRNRLRVDTLQRIEAFLADAERSSRAHGVAEQRAAFERAPTPKHVISLEEARALKASPRPKLAAEERDHIIRELVELGDAYRALPHANARSEDDILGYAEDGIPEQ